MKVKEFIAAFQLSKTIILEVNYYTLSTNLHPYFTTCAGQFCRNKRDWARVGQCQKELLKDFPAARRFYERWNPVHLRKLTDEKYAELRRDLEELCKTYNYLFKELDESKQPYSPGFMFEDLAEWSKMTPKKETSAA